MDKFMNKPIIWNTSWDLFSDAECSQAILDNSSGIMIDADRRSHDFYTNSFYNLTKSPTTLFNSILLLNPYYEDMLKRFPEIKTWYIDEFYSNPQNQGNRNKVLQGEAYLFNNKTKLIFGEIDTNVMLGSNEEITYTAYQDLWFKIFGIRIYKPFSNQIPMWNKLEEKYNLGKSLSDLFTSKIRVLTDHTGISQEIEKIAENHPSKFNYCWIKLGQRDTDKCIKWANEHSKQILLYIPTNLSKGTFLTLLNKFNRSI